MNDAADSKYLCEPQQRLMRMLLALAGHELEGLAPGDIAKQCGHSPSQVTRDLANARHFGWAEQIQSTSRWRLGPQFGQTGLRILTAFERAESRLAEIKNRFTRNLTDV